MAVTLWRASPAKAPALCALGVGISLALVAALWLRNGQERAWHGEVRKLAQDRAEVIRGQVARSVEVSDPVAALFAARGQVTRAEFKSFVERPLSRQPECLIHFYLGMPQSHSWSPFRLTRWLLVLPE